jgi:hypothetical protein
MAEESNRMVVGVFRSQEDAEKGVNALAQAGFPPSEIGFIGPGQADEPGFPKAALGGTAGGGVAGAVAGGLLGVASMAVAPGIGPIVTVGAWLPPLIGVVTGGSAGGTLGGLLTLAGLSDAGLHYRQQVQAGRSIVNIRTERAEDARRAMEEVGALEVADVGDSESAKEIADLEEKSSDS